MTSTSPSTRPPERSSTAAGTGVGGSRDERRFSRIDIDRIDAVHVPAKRPEEDARTVGRPNGPVIAFGIGCEEAQVFGTRVEDPDGGRCPPREQRPDHERDFRAVGRNARHRVVVRPDRQRLLAAVAVDPRERGLDAGLSAGAGIAGDHDKCPGIGDGEVRRVGDSVVRAPQPSTIGTGPPRTVRATGSKGMAKSAVPCA